MVRRSRLGILRPARKSASDGTAATSARQIAAKFSAAGRSLPCWRRTAEHLRAIGVGEVVGAEQDRLAAVTEAPMQRRVLDQRSKAQIDGDEREPVDSRAEMRQGAPRMLKMLVAGLAAEISRHAGHEDAVVIDQLQPLWRDDHVAVLDVAVRDAVLFEKGGKRRELAAQPLERPAVAGMAVEPDAERFALGPVHLDERIPAAADRDAVGEIIEADEIGAFQRPDRPRDRRVFMLRPRDLAMKAAHRQPPRCVAIM